MDSCSSHFHTTPCEGSLAPSPTVAPPSETAADIIIRGESPICVEETAVPTKRSVTGLLRPWRTLGWASLFVAVLLFGSALLVQSQSPPSHHSNWLHQIHAASSHSNLLKAWTPIRLGTRCARALQALRSLQSLQTQVHRKLRGDIAHARGAATPSSQLPVPVVDAEQPSSVVRHADFVQQTMGEGKVVIKCAQGKALALPASMSCAMILSKYYKSSTPMYVKYNGGSACQGRLPLPKGTQLCIP